MIRERQAAVVVVLIAVVAISAVAAIRWNLAHPVGAGWDESHYINQAYHDARFLAEGGVIRLVKALLFEDPVRPPAYRALAIPLTAIAGPSVQGLRFVSLAGFLLTVLIFFLAARQRLDTGSAAFAAALLSASPAVVAAIAWFGTEYPLYLAIALTMLFLFRLLDEPSKGNIIGLAIALALGALSKTTYLLIGPPMWLAALAVVPRRRGALVTSAALAALLSSPWWFFHFAPALQFATTYGGTFARVELGGQAFAQKLAILSLYTIGLPALILVALVLARSLRCREQTIDRATLIIAAAGTIPLLLTALLSGVFVARHVTPALMPLALIVGLVAERSGWLHPRWTLVVTTTLLIVQVTPMAVPERLNVGSQGVSSPTQLLVASAGVMEHIPETDWNELREICISRGIREPRIAFLGNAPTLTPPEISFPWIARGENVEVQWLWRLEQGTIDWNKVMAAAQGSDVVLVIAGQPLPRPRMALSPAVDERVVDNQHNVEFIARLSSFASPVELRHAGGQSVLIWLRKP